MARLHCRTRFMFWATSLRAALRKSAGSYRENHFQQSVFTQPRVKAGGCTFGCCARAARGQTATMPRAATNSRRPMVTGIMPLSVRGLPSEWNNTPAEHAVVTFGRAGMSMLRRNCNDRSGSKARITVPQHCCPLRPE